MHADTIISDEAIKYIEMLTKDFIWGFFKVSLNLNKTKYKNFEKDKILSEKTKTIIYETYLDDFNFFNYPK